MSLAVAQSQRLSGAGMALRSPRCALDISRIATRKRSAQPVPCSVALGWRGRFDQAVVAQWQSALEAGSVGYVRPLCLVACPRLARAWSLSRACEQRSLMPAGRCADRAIYSVCWSPDNQSFLYCSGRTLPFVRCLLDRAQCVRAAGASSSPLAFVCRLHYDQVASRFGQAEQMEGARGHRAEGGDLC